MLAVYMPCTKGALVKFRLMLYSSFDIRRDGYFVLAAAKVSTAIKFDRVVEVKQFADAFPHRCNVSFDPCHLKVVNVDRQKEAVGLMVIKAFPSFAKSKTQGSERRMAMSFPIKAC